MKRKLIKGLLFFIFNFVLILIVIFIFYKNYISKLDIKIPPNTNYTGLDDEDFYLLQNSVFKIDYWKDSHFRNFNKEKDDEIIRIGCFGDSFSYGDEVNNILDYPSQLKNIYKEQGLKNVEVINFSMSWQGLHQQFIVWDLIGREYDLDYVLILPNIFWYDRDSKFNHSFSQNYINGDPEYLHSRYILNGQDVKLINVHGNNIAEKIYDYWSFIPRWRYIRFDSEIPVLLRAPLSVLSPEKKILHNPFYYKKDVEEEMKSIYPILLNKISEHVKLLVVGNHKGNIFGENNKDIINTDMKLNKNIRVSRVYSSDDFPYLAVGGHNSPLGNRLLADQMYSHLQDKKRVEYTVLVTKDSDMLVTDTKLNDNHLSLNDYEDIFIKVKNKLFGRFYNRDLHWHINCKEKNCRMTKNIFERVSSMIAIHNKDLSNSLFLPLDVNINNNMPVSIEVNRDGKKLYKNLGFVNFIDSEIPIGIIDIGQYDYDKKQNFPSWKTYLLFKNFGINHDLEFKIGDNVQVMLGDIILLKAQIKSNDNEIYFNPNTPRKDVFSIHQVGDRTINVSELEDKETMYLELIKNGVMKKIPIGNLYIKTVTF